MPAKENSSQALKETQSLSFGEVRGERDGQVVRLQHPKFGSTVLIDITDEPDLSTLDHRHPNATPDIVKDLMTKEISDPKYEGAYGHNNGLISVITNKLSETNSPRVYLGFSLVDPEDPEAKEITTYILNDAGIIHPYDSHKNIYVPFSFDNDNLEGNVAALLKKVGVKNPSETDQSNINMLPGSNTALIKQLKNKLELSETEEKIYLWQVASIAHQYGQKMADRMLADCINHLQHNPDKELELTRDQQRLRSYQLDHDSKGWIRSITMYLGPHTDDVDTMTEYPRLQFFFRSKDPNFSKWDFSGAQIGLRGHMIGTQRIIDLAKAGETRSFLIDRKIELGSIVEQLQEYMDPDKK